MALTKRTKLIIFIVALITLINLSIFGPQLMRGSGGSGGHISDKETPIPTQQQKTIIPVPQSSPPTTTTTLPQQKQQQQQEEDRLPSAVDDNNNNNTKEQQQQEQQAGENDDGGDDDKRLKLLQTVQKDLSTCQKVHKLKLVIIDTRETHDKVRLLVGSIHQYHQGNVKIYIYGLNLNDAIEDEILLWEYVTYFNIEKEFITSSKADQSPSHLDEKLWRSIVIYDALDRAGKVLFLSSYLILKQALPQQLFDDVEKRGAYFATVSQEKAISYSKEGTVDSRELSFVSDHHSADMQGYVLGSRAYKYFLEPYISCARRQCPQKELFMLDVNWRKSDEMTADDKLAMSIEHLPSTIRAMDSMRDKNSQCSIINREDFIHSYKQLPGTPNKSWEVSVTSNQARAAELKDRTIIALGFPSTSKGNRNPSIDNIPFTRVFLPSLLPTLIPDKDKFHFILYMGFDEGDSFYDVPENRQQLRERVARLVGNLPVEFRMIRVVNSNGWVPFIWNALLQHSVDDGCDYFYQLNDDIRFKTPGWASAFTNTLANSPLGPNVGVSGPLDEGNRNILTQAFVHKTHYDIFGFLYPYVFRNWYSDDWITLVYKDIGGLLRHKDYLVHNVQSFGTRYHVCDFSAMLQSSLERGRERIRKWREAKGSQ